MAGIQHVAELAGVSTATVSRALSGNGHVSPETRRRVEEAARQLGYVVSSSASGLASGRTKNIGMVVPFLDRWFYSAVIDGAEAELRAAGYDLILYNIGGGPEQRRRVFEHFLLRKRVDAVIAVSLELTEHEIGRLLELGKPVVGVGGPLADVPTLSIDDVAIARLATEHLLSLGHRRIAHIGGDKESEMDFHLPTHRRTGFEEALRAAGLDAEAAPFRPADFTMRGAFQAAKQLLGVPHERPTAVFAASDEMAIGAILAARELGLSVPGDVSIVGIDDHELSDFFGLTTVSQFPRRQGQEAVRLLLDEIATGRASVARDVALDYELIVRSSTSRPAD